MHKLSIHAQQIAFRTGSILKGEDTLYLDKGNMLRWKGKTEIARLSHENLALPAHIALLESHREVE